MAKSVDLGQALALDPDISGETIEVLVSIEAYPDTIPMGVRAQIGTMVLEV